MATKVKCKECGHEWESQAKHDNIDAGKITCKSEDCESTDIAIIGTVESTESIEDQANALGVKGSRVNTARFTGKDLVKETARNEKVSAKRLTNRVEKAQARESMAPIDRRREMIKAKLRAEKSSSERRYSNTSLKYLVNELKVINNTPKVWNERTQDGKEAYPISAPKKRSVMQDVEEMDLD